MKWIRERTVQLLTLAESVIAVLVGFEHVAWSVVQTGLVMSLVAATLGVVAYADHKALKNAVDLYELSKAERDEWDRAALEELGR